MNINHIVPVKLGYIAQHFNLGYAGIIDKHIYFSEIGCDAFYRSRHLFSGGNICLICRAAEFIFKLTGFFIGAFVDYSNIVCFCEGTSHSTADSSCSACNNYCHSNPFDYKTGIALPAGVNAMPCLFTCLLPLSRRRLRQRLSVICCRRLRL